MEVRQIYFEALDTVVVRTVEEPREPGPGEALLAPAYVGICASDLHLLHGKHPFFKPPVITGHEMVAVVKNIGPEVTNVAPGDHVVLNPLFTCGTCRSCRRGAFNTCESNRVTGYRLPGVAQTQVVIAASHLYRLPKELSLEKACLLEPLTVGVHAAALYDDLEDVLVIGGGTIGLCVLLALRARGAGRVSLIEPIAHKRDLAKRLGAAEVFSPDQVQVTPRYSASFECVGGQRTFDVASGSTLSGGCVVVIGVSPGPVSVPMPRMQRFEMRIQGSGMYVGKDMEHAIELMASGKVDVGPLISMVRPLDEAPEAYAAALQTSSAVKILVRMN